MLTPLKGLVIQNKRVLFLCTGNSCRSQIAEGLARKYLNNYTIESAGTNPETVNPIAIEVMREIDIDLSNHYSKSITDEQIKSFDIAITLCGDAKDKCLNIKSLVKQHIHWDIIDPAKATGTNEEKFNIYTSVRDLIEIKIKELDKQLN